MRRSEVDKYIRIAVKAVSSEIADIANGGDSFYARGLASEGYSGGYRDALHDIQLLLNGVIPNRRNYWKRAEREGGKA